MYHFINGVHSRQYIFKISKVRCFKPSSSRLNQTFIIEITGRIILVNNIHFVWTKSQWVFLFGYHYDQRVVCVEPIFFLGVPQRDMLHLCESWCNPKFKMVHWKTLGQVYFALNNFKMRNSVPPVTRAVPRTVPRSRNFRSDFQVLDVCAFYTILVYWILLICSHHYVPQYPYDKWTTVMG